MIRNGIASAFLCILLLALCACSKRIPLGNGYVFTDSKNGPVILAPSGKTAAGPAIDTIWGSYPYIHGWFNDKADRGRYKTFLLNIESGALILEPEKTTQEGSLRHDKCEGTHQVSLYELQKYPADFNDNSFFGVFHHRNAELLKQLHRPEAQKKDFQQ